MEKLETVPLDAISIPKNHIRVQSIDEKAIKKLADSINYTNLPRAKELIKLLNALMESGALRTTLAQYHASQ